MGFADEDHFSRRFVCGWAFRAQTAFDIAERTQRLAARLSDVEPDYRTLRPDPGLREFRENDPGLILETTTEDLAKRIDRRDRFDLPRYPAPVGPRGYDSLYRNESTDADDLALSISVQAGIYGLSILDNLVQVWPDTAHSLWNEPVTGIAILHALVEVWEPEWVCAYGFIPAIPKPGEYARGRVRPWLAWTAKPLQPRPNPPFPRPYPHPFPLEDAGPPAEVRADHGGELKIWP